MFSAKVELEVSASDVYNYLVGNLYKDANEKNELKFEIEDLKTGFEFTRYFSETNFITYQIMELTQDQMYSVNATTLYGSVDIQYQIEAIDESKCNVSYSENTIVNNAVHKAILKFKKPFITKGFEKKIRFHLYDMEKRIIESKNNIE